MTLREAAARLANRRTTPMRGIISLANGPGPRRRARTGGTVQEMGVARNLERRLEGILEGFFAKVFRSGLQPVEVGRRIEALKCARAV